MKEILFFSQGESAVAKRGKNKVSLSIGIQIEFFSKGDMAVAKRGKNKVSLSIVKQI